MSFILTYDKRSMTFKIMSSHSETTLGRFERPNMVFAAEPLRGSPPNLLQGLKNLENLFVCLTSSNQIAFIGHAS